jgi:outer membrane immunogenic protein
MRPVLIAAVAFLAFNAIQPASAAEMPAPPPRRPVQYTPPPPPIFSWTGFYIGGNGGGGSAHDNFNLTGTSVVGTFGNSGSFDYGGGILGGQIGFNYEFGPSHWVIGVEGDGDWARLQGTSSACSTFTGGAFAGLPAGCATNNVSLNNFETVRGRVGYAFDTGSYTFPSVLVYATGGGAWANSSGGSTTTCLGILCPGTSLGPFTGGGASFHDSLSGWTAGAGFEWAFFQHWTARFEYLHLGFNNVSTNYTTTAVFATGPLTANTHISSNIGVDVVRFGVNYLFNWY